MSRKLGKIDIKTIEKVIIPQCGVPRENVIANPSFGVDVAVIRLNEELGIALTSDPLTYIPSLGIRESAWLSVHILANDMATTGFTPQYAQMVLNLSPSMSEEEFTLYWSHIHQFCQEIDLTITGGHTGFIEGQNSTIAGGATFITIAPLKKIILSSNASPGDIILMTKTAALSSTAILALSFPETIQSKLGKESYEELKSLFYQTSSLKEALIARKIDDAITAMHDVTEGGILGAIYELSTASKVGCKVEYNKIPVTQTQNEICTLFQLDPCRIIGAGSMIMCCKKNKENDVINTLNKHNILCTPIGEILPDPNEKYMIKDKISFPLEYFDTDPYWEAFFNAFNKGWK